MSRNIRLWFEAVLRCSSNRGGRYAEDDAKVVVAQILNIVAFCHLQGVVHRDLKPEVRYIEYCMEHSSIFLCPISTLPLSKGFVTHRGNHWFQI